MGILSSVLHSDGAYRNILYVDGGPSSNALVGHVRMEGKEVFRHAVEKLAAVMDEALDAAQMDAKQIDWLVPHQANIRIIDAMQKDGIGIGPRDTHGRTACEYVSCINTVGTRGSSR